MAKGQPEQFQARREVAGFGVTTLPAGFDHQNHAGPQDGDILVCPLQCGYGGVVGGGDGVEGLARFYFVVQDSLT